jgi:FkbM family methyltransferase
MQLVAALMERAGGRVSATPEGEVLVEVRGLKFFVNTYEDFFILNEVFVLGTYDFFLPRGCVVWDIGTNIGIASLLFASRTDVKQVYSFEPFPQTAQLARKNLELNPEFAPKIVLTEAGLGCSDREDTGFYSPDYKGGSGLQPIPAHLPQHSARTEKIRILDAATAMHQITRDHPGVPLVLKCDCEGAEEEIFARLAETGELQRITMVLVEYHAQGPLRLQRMLQEFGFSGVTLVSPIPGAGMIYAKR